MQNINKIILLITVLSVFSCVGLAQDEIEGMPNLCIRGILFDSKHPMAIINDRYIKEDELVLGARVVEITEKSVQFDYEGQIFTKEVGKDCLKVVSPSKGTIYLGKEKEDLTDTVKKIINMPAVSKNRNREDMEKVEKFLSYFKKHQYLIIGIILLWGILFYIFYGVTLQTIASKTDTEKGWLAWIPIGNLYLECKIADRPGWWLLLRLLPGFIPIIGPVITIIVTIIIWVGIAQARSKPGWLGILAIVPLFNIFLLGYLAFSKAEEKAEATEEISIDIGTAKKYEG